MAEEDLKKAIQERIRREKDNILNQSRQEVDKILRESEDEASLLKEKYLAEIKKRYFLKKTKELSQINLEIKRQFLEVKEKRICEVLSLVEEELKSIHQNKNRYKSIFRHFLEESLEIFERGVGSNQPVHTKLKLKLKVNSSDRELALEILKEFAINSQLETTESIEDGLILSDLEQNLTILNTFSSRLEKLRPQLRQEVSKILFGEW